MKRKDRDNPEYKEKNRVYQNEWYHKNKDKCLKTRKLRLNKLRHQYHKYKIEKGCFKCGENHPACLDLHHPDSSKKEGNPGTMITQRGWSFEKFKNHFDDLQVLCSNCHRKLHYGHLSRDISMVDS